MSEKEMLKTKEIAPEQAHEKSGSCERYPVGF